MSSESNIAFEITPEGEVKEIPADAFVEFFRANNVLAIYVPGLSRLFLWRGASVNPMLARHIPKAKSLILDQAPEGRDFHILRQIVVDSGDETNEFLAALDLTRELINEKVNKSEEEYLRALREKIDTLVEREEFFLQNLQYDKAIEKANEVIYLATKIGDEALERKQHEFVEFVSKKKEEGEVLLRKRAELQEKLGRLETLLGDNILEAHEIAKDIKFEYDEYESLIGDPEVQAILGREREAFREFKSSQSNLRDSVVYLKDDIGEEIRRGNLPGARHSLDELKENLSAITDGEFVEEWTPRVSALKEAIEREEGLEAKIGELREKVEQAFEEGRYDDVRDASADLVELSGRVENEKLAGEVEDFIDEYVERLAKVEETRKEEALGLGEEVRKALDEKRFDDAHERAEELRSKLEVIPEVASEPFIEDVLNRERVEYETYQDESKASEEEGRLKERALEEYNDLVERAMSAREAGNFSEAIELLTRTLEICDEWEMPEERTSAEEELESAKRKLEEVEARQRSEQERRDVEDKISKDLEDVEQLRAEFSFDAALERLAEDELSAEELGLVELKEEVSRRRESIEQAREEFTKKNELLELLAERVESYVGEKRLQAAHMNCQKIIELAPEVGKEGEVSKYKDLMEALRREMEKLEAEREAELKALVEKADEVREMIETEESVLPLVEEFSVEELLGDLSGDVDELMDRVGGLLEDHRVEVKQEVQSFAVLKSASGEVLEIDREITAKPAFAQGGVGGAREDGVPAPKGPVKYEITSGLDNPFDDYIEEAVLEDIVPYNFEVSEVLLNGEAPNPDAEPEQSLTKDGLELKWTLRDIPPKEKVEINYDLRARVSRTLIMTRPEELKIVKTHANLSPLEVSGLYEALLKFRNKLSALPLVVIEDIIPLYYLHEVLAPRGTPDSTSEGGPGTFVKWNIRDVPENYDELYEYLLLEL
ncbi:MAG: hypothetical protein ACTSU5_10220, partial [Promethearchaeota archaeon]